LCYPTPSEERGREKAPQSPNSRATPQGLGPEVKMEEIVPKIAHLRDSEAGKNSTSIVKRRMSIAKRRMIILRFAMLVKGAF